jgi:diacylglycerol kinase (ATP)
MKFLQSLKYAIRGIALAASGHNLRIQLVCAVAAVTAGFYFVISFNEWLAIIICFGGVLSAEVMNTAIEKMADFVHPQKNEKIGQLKDMAAGAVLIWATASLVVALIIFLPKIFW